VGVGGKKTFPTTGSWTELTDGYRFQATVDNGQVDGQTDVYFFAVNGGRAIAGRSPRRFGRQFSKIALSLWTMCHNFDGIL
jgi:hypothetical protein